MSHKKYRKETNCLNCGSEVRDKFCPNCGQENVDLHENFFHMAGEFLSDYFHFDSKFFRSLIPLITKPGFLTAEYWAGRRVHYIPPLRLFFFITIIFMICSTFFYNHYGHEIRKSLFKRSKNEMGYDSAYVSSLPDTMRLGKVTAKEIKDAYTTRERQFQKLNKGVDSTFRNLKYVTFVLLPFYALVFKVLYRRRRPYYIDHLTFAMHVQSFSYIAMGILIFLPLAFPGILTFLGTILFIIILGYLLAAVHRLYHQPWWKTIVKSVLATMACFFMTLLCILISSAIDAIFIQ